MSRQEPVPVRGVWLRGDGRDIVVDVELEDGRWVEAIREFAANTDTISHIVEPAGIRNAPPHSLADTPTPRELK